MPRGAAFTKLLLGALIPLCVWGMIATLLMQLVAIRSAFVEGGEWQLRQGLVAFALGVVLIEKLRLQQGRSTAVLYGMALGAAITLFSAWHAAKWRIPGFAPLFIFVLNQTFFAILWWTGAKTTRACASDAESAAASLDTGIMAKRMGKVESMGETDPFADRLPSRHPGRVIFHFALVAVPVFGLGVYFVATVSREAAVQVGALLFLYLLCSFLLLALSSLGQLVAYFAEREVALPDRIGLTWISIAIVSVTLILLLALALPQPPSPARSGVRNQIVSIYHGWQHKRGVRDSSKIAEENPDARRGGDRTGRNAEPGDGKHGDKGGDGKGGKEKGGSSDGDSSGNGKGKGEKGQGSASQNGKSDAGQRDGKGSRSPSPSSSSTPDVITGKLGAVFRVVIIALVAAMVIALIIIVLAMLGGTWGRLAHGLSGLFRRRDKKAGASESESGSGLAQHPAWPDVPDPFAPGAPKRTAGEIARICWTGLIAYCADRREPCPPHVTPFEFVEALPTCLDGFEEQSRKMAELFALVEFSQAGVPESRREELRLLWAALKSRANAP